VKRRQGLPRTTSRTFVIRFVVDDTDDLATALRGQLSEPTCEEGWFATFASADECMQLLRGRLQSKVRRHRHKTKP
jgi:hypothetical protein